jgi:hypothetical protein
MPMGVSFPALQRRGGSDLELNVGYVPELDVLQMVGVIQLGGGRMAEVPTHDDVPKRAQREDYDSDLARVGRSVIIARPAGRIWERAIDTTFLISHCRSPEDAPTGTRTFATTRMNGPRSC